MYSPLTPRRADFDMVRDLMIQTGVLERRIAFEEYTDTRFAERSDGYNAWRFDPGDTVAH